MLKLAIAALVCARALALPAAPDTDTALTPPDVERTKRTKAGRWFRKKAGGARPGVSGVSRRRAKQVQNFEAAR